MKIHLTPSAVKITQKRQSALTSWAVPGGLDPLAGSLWCSTGCSICLRRNERTVI